MIIGVIAVLFLAMEKSAIHVVCSPKTEYLAIITAYIPSAEEWEDDFKKKKQI